MLVGIDVAVTTTMVQVLLDEVEEDLGDDEPGVAGEVTFVEVDNDDVFWRLRRPSLVVFATNVSMVRVVVTVAILMKC